MVSVNPSISMGNFKRYCTNRAASLNEIITIPTPKEVSRLEELYSGLKDQFKRMHAKWEYLLKRSKMMESTKNVRLTTMSQKLLLTDK